jgi:hypothetical protein
MTIGTTGRLINYLELKLNGEICIGFHLGNVREAGRLG